MIVGSFRDSWDMYRIPQTFLGFLGYVRDLSNIFEIFEKFVGSLKDFFGILGITMGSLRDFWDYFANLMIDLGILEPFFILGIVQGLFYRQFQDSYDHFTN